MIGILLLDKPLGLSSNQATQRVKRLLKAGKAGHVGSLDPLATGMLPICLGEATKIAGDILSGRKKYLFTVKLGERTATGDTEGAIVETSVIPVLSHADVEAVLSRFLGPQRQVPPMYSAIKKDGQPLYKLARAGQEIERAARDIEIFELRLVGFDSAALQLEALSSKGTYVRSLAEDIAKALGTCGHVTALRRAYVEPFESDLMQTLEELALAPKLLPADYGVQHLPKVAVSGEGAARLSMGQIVAIESPQLAGRVRLYDEKGEFFGIGEAEAGQVRPRRLWAEGAAGRIARLAKSVVKTSI
jgi:tRNA pseudouridine55 synthase